MNRLHFLITALLLQAYPLFAQVRDSLDRIEVITYTKYSPVLTAARKLSTVPVFETQVVKLPTFDYVLPEFRYSVSPTYRPAKAAEIKTDGSYEVNDNYFRLGGGNYLSGLAEVHLHNKQSEKYDFGGYARHFSSNASNPENADFSDNLLGVFGTKTTRKGSLNGALNYERHVVHYFAVPDSQEWNKSHINQIFNDLHGEVGWKSNPSQKGLGLESSVEGGLFSTLKQRENHLAFQLNPFLQTRRLGRMTLYTSLDFSSLSFGDSSLNRFFLDINPSYRFRFKKLELKTGFRIVSVLTTAKNTTLLFPDVEAKHYIVPERMNAYIRLGGGVEQNRLRQIAYRNPFVADRVDIRHSVNQFEFAGGIKGTLARKVDYLLGVNYRSFTDLPLFITDSTPLKRFTTLYDRVGILAFETGLGVRLNEKFFVQWAGNFYTYNTDLAANAWQLPAYDIDLNLKYTFGKKLHIRLQSYIVGERYQLNPETNKSMKLKPFGDISLLTEYRYSKYMAFFLNLNNIANARYQKWYAYPAYGLNVLAGLSFSL